MPERPNDGEQAVAGTTLLGMGERIAGNDLEEGLDDMVNSLRPSYGGFDAGVRIGVCKDGKGTEESGDDELFPESSRTRDLGKRVS